MLKLFICSRILRKEIPIKKINEIDRNEGSGLQKDIQVWSSFANFIGFSDHKLCTSCRILHVSDTITTDFLFYYMMIDKLAFLICYNSSMCDCMFDLLIPEKWSFPWQREYYHWLLIGTIQRHIWWTFLPMRSFIMPLIDWLISV